MKKLTKKTGFTLVELLLFIGLFSILLTVLTQMFITIVETQLDSQSSSGVSQDSRYIFNRLSYDIHQAKNLIVPPLPIGTTTPSLKLNNGSDYEYKQTDGNLILSIGLTDYRLNSHSTSISNLYFQRLGDNNTPPMIKISYTITSNIQEVSGQESKFIETVIGLRHQ